MRVVRQLSPAVMAGVVYAVHPGHSMVGVMAMSMRSEFRGGPGGCRGACLFIAWPFEGNSRIGSGVSFREIRRTGRREEKARL